MTFFKSYLSDRTQSVCVDKSLSDSYLVPHGVPQGSVLGPLLFVLFINDISTIVHDSKIRLFADDIKIYKEIESPNDCDKFQADINKISNWLDENKLILSGSKSGLLRIGTKFGDCPGYLLEGTQITSYKEFRDLGVIIDNDLTFSSHIAKLSSQSTQKSRCITRSFRCPDDDFKLNMHKTFVLPTVEFASSVWCPYKIGEIKVIETVQRRFSKYLDFHHSISYVDRCKKLDILPLVYRRIIADLVLTYKIIHELFSGVTREEFFTMKSPTARGHCLQIFKTRTNKSQRTNFFAERVIDNWNALPPEIVKSGTVKQFKNRLTKLFKNKTDPYHSKIMKVFNRKWPNVLDKSH